MNYIRLSMLAEAAAREAARTIEGPVSLISIQFDVLADGEGSARARITRATRTLVFSEAELVGSSGERLIVASAVHRRKED